MHTSSLSQAVAAAGDGVWKMQTSSQGDPVALPVQRVPKPGLPVPGDALADFSGAAHIAGEEHNIVS